MTVRELINALNQFDENMEVRIGMKQKWGSDFAMEISEEIEELTVNSCWGNDKYKAVILTEGDQIGTVNYDGDDEDDDYEDEDDDEDYEDDEEE